MASINGVRIHAGLTTLCYVSTVRDAEQVGTKELVYGLTWFAHLVRCIGISALLQVLREMREHLLSYTNSQRWTRERHRMPYSQLSQYDHDFS